jgi:hypothetical protein
MSLKIFFLFLLFFVIQLNAQIPIFEPERILDGDKEIGYKVSYLIIDGDTVPVINLRTAEISADRIFSSKREERKWSRLKRDVAKVYPYSKIAGKKLEEYNNKMIGMSEKEQKKMLKKAEGEIKKEFEKDVRNMTLNQGRILIKLIDRETGNTSYSLVKDLRGTFQAFFWQSLARIFSADLKSEYDPQKNAEDKMIEDIIISIEDGTFQN